MSIDSVASNLDDYLLQNRILRNLGDVWATYYDLVWYKEQDNDSTDVRRANLAYEKANDYYQASLEVLAVALDYGLDTTDYAVESAATTDCMALLHFKEARGDSDQEEALKNQSQALLDMLKAGEVLKESHNSLYELDHITRMLWILKFKQRMFFRDRALELTAPGTNNAKVRAAILTTLLLGGRVQRISLWRMVDESWG
ncbi:MAG: hypothetical protein WAQ27_03275 [Candidatus Microsaccharimonas sp.]